MNLFKINFRTSVIAVILVSLFSVSSVTPAHSIAGSYQCGSSAGTFTITGTTVVSSTDNCAGAVTIPEGVTAIGNDAFYTRSLVTSVLLPSTLQTIGSSGFRTTSITSISIPVNVTSIGELAFSINAVNVTSVTFADNSKLTTIGNYAFQYTDFTTITISALVTSIGLDIFIDNTNLSSIYLLGAVTGGGSFSRTAGITAYVTTSNRAGYGATWRGVTVASPPSAPTSLVATSGDATASVVFTAGADNDAAISNYKYSFDNITYTALSPADAVTPVVIPGLTNGTTYSIYLKAVNAAGDGIASASVSVTPLGAPVFTLSASTESRTVNTAATGFTINSTGSAIAGFAISATPSGMSFNTSTGALTGTPNTVALATTYTITATNTAGTATQTFTLTVTAAPVSADNSAAQAAAQAEAARKAREQQELREILALIPKIGELTLSLGETTKSLYSTKCVKGKSTKFVKKGAKCPRGFARK
jgi:hypothetical protein